MAFRPKQITDYDAAYLAELQGDVITETIMGMNPPPIHIHAADINPKFVAGCQALAEKNKWPVTTAVMSAQEITFPDDTFTHSITSFAFHCLGNHDQAVHQVYRTLKPGGTAIATIWIFMPHAEALQHAHWRTRGKDGPMLALLPLEGFTEPDLRKALEVGGFKLENISCSKKACYLKIPDLKDWAQLAWSYLGHLPSGWSQNDEDKWNEAIDDIVKELESGDGISKNEKGETVLKMISIVAVAKK